jgi:NAD(P)-dependent dehydrogenase (short-subunit alcohol dehydrogenase family)
MTDKGQKVAIITGGSQGIGASLVTAYRRRGWSVVATARTMKPTEDPDVLTVDGNLADPATADRIVSGALGRFGSLDTLMNNTDVYISKPFTDYTTEDYALVVGVNLTRFFWLTQRVITDMVQRCGGHTATGASRQRACRTLGGHDPPRVPRSVLSWKSSKRSRATRPNSLRICGRAPARRSQPRVRRWCGGCRRQPHTAGVAERQASQIAHQPVAAALVQRLNLAAQQRCRVVAEFAGNGDHGDVGGEGLAVTASDGVVVTRGRLPWEGRETVARPRYASRRSATSASASGLRRRGARAGGR